MTDSPFATPAPPGEGIKWDDLHGALLLIEPAGLDTNIETAYGASDAVRADVTVLEGPEPGKVYGDTLIFPKVLQSQLKSRIGQKVLGRLGQGEAKKGQSPPWILQPATDQDQQTGIRYLNSRSGQQITQPAPQQQQGWQGQQPQQNWPQQQQGQSVPF